jgi:hypothetical protein
MHEPSIRTNVKPIQFAWCCAVLALALAVILPKPASAQNDAQDDPPGRVARLGFLQGSVSFQPAGESDWVGAVPNRPMTTGDQLWSDENSRAEVQLGSAAIRLNSLTGFSFLNLDDNTVQVQLTSGAINVTVRRLHDNDDFEIDTPNQAFTIYQPGHYRVEVGADGSYTAITVREGDGESTGGGQSYEIRGGQSATLTGTDQLYADVEPLYESDDFDAWSDSRDHRFDYSRSARYLAPDVVGFEDLDENGDWRDDPAYGHIWYPNRVDAGWAPYHVGHWAWISPWGWTWVDDNAWGYAPFHYGRWVSVGGRWGWVAGPVEVQAVYAPALVVFIGGGPGGWGGNVGWFALGPREVYVPSYHVSEAYVTRVNVSSTTVNVTQVTNIYRTTIVNNNTTVTNITYANRNVQGAVMVVPQHAFVSAQPVAAARVQVSAQQIASAPMASRVAVAPTNEAVLGAKASSAGRVAAPPAAVAARQVVAKKTPPPPPVPFAKQQQALAAHPGEPVAKTQLATLRPPAAARPVVRVAPPAKKATPTTGHPPANVPARPAANHPGQPAPAAHPAPAPAQPNRPAPAQSNRPAPEPPNNRPEPNRPQPTPPASRPAPTQPPARPEPTPARPAPTPPAVHPESAPARPENHPAAAQPNRPEPAPKPAPAPAEHPQPRTPPPAAKPAPPPAKPQAKPPAKPLTPEEKKRQEEEQKK